MKVMHVSLAYPGGIASYLAEIYPFQVESMGKSNVLVASPGSQAEHLSFVPQEALRIFIYKDRNFPQLVSSAVQLRAIIKKDRPDLIHLHSTFAGLVLRAYWILFPWEYRPKVIYCSHGWSFTMKANWKKKKAFALIERFLAKNTDAIVNISRHEHDAAISFGMPRKIMREIPNGIADIPAAKEIKTSFGSGTINALFVGRLDEQKGFDYALKAMNLLSDVPITLHVVGERIVSRPENKHLDKSNVVYYGWRSRGEVQNFIAGADVVIMPSRWEGFGLTAVEAMRAGKPVFASDVGALSSSVKDGVSGYLFPEGDIDKLAHLLRSATRARLEDLGRSAREWYLNNYTSDKMNTDLMRLYMDLMTHDLN